MVCLPSIRLNPSSFAALSLSLLSLGPVKHSVGDDEVVLLLLRSSSCLTQEWRFTYKEDLADEYLVLAAAQGEIIKELVKRAEHINRLELPARCLCCQVALCCAVLHGATLCNAVLCCAVL